MRSFCINPLAARIYAANYLGSSIAVIRDSAVSAVAGFQPVAETPHPQPTINRGILPQPGKQKATLLDITGRRVMDLAPGPNDIRHIAPGVYFLHQPTADGRQLTAVRKVVVQR